MLIALMLLAASTASPQLTRCLATGGAARGQTMAMRECMRGELNRRDDALNAAYRVALARSGPRRATLVAAERRWITHRDATCQRQLGPNTGTLGGLDYDACMIDQTAAPAPSGCGAGASRSRDLNAFAVSCPGGWAIRECATWTDASC